MGFISLFLPIMRVAKLLRVNTSRSTFADSFYKSLSIPSPCGSLSVCCFQDQEKGHLQQLQSLMPSYRARPSLLGPLAAAAGFSLGAAAGVLPTKYAHAITGEPYELVNAKTGFYAGQSCLQAHETPFSYTICNISGCWLAK